MNTGYVMGLVLGINELHTMDPTHFTEALPYPLHCSPFHKRQKPGDCKSKIVKITENAYTTGPQFAQNLLPILRLEIIIPQEWL